MDPQVLAEIRSAICAVGYFTQEPETYAQNVESGGFTILGTGFLVEERTVLTNRHVVRNLEMFVEKDEVPLDRRRVMLHSFADDTVYGRAAIIEDYAYSYAPGIDLALLTISPPPSQGPFANPKPVTIASVHTLSTGDPIAMMGYPFGHALLEQDSDFGKRVYRFGPVLQQGHVSALAPFDTHGAVDRYLLDMSTSAGMSGAPVFDPVTGQVFGVHDRSMERGISFALPLSEELVQRLLIAQGDHRSSGELVLVELPPVLRARRPSSA